MVQGMKVVLLIALLALAWAATGQRDSDTPATTRAAVERAVREFLTAFENLDWERFAAAFDDDATVFFPVPEPPDRFTGRSSFEPRFQKVFAAIRTANPGGPPYHQLTPEELQVDVLAQNVALASFLLRNDQRTARRTLVLIRIKGTWRIHHLHASNVLRE